MRPHFFEPANGRKCLACGITILGDGAYEPNRIGIFHLSCLFDERDKGPKKKVGRPKGRKNKRKLPTVVSEPKREHRVSLRLTLEEKRRINLVAKALGKTSPRWGTNFSAAIKYLIGYALKHLEPNEGDPDAERRLPPEEEAITKEPGFQVYIHKEGVFRSDR